MAEVKRPMMPATQARSRTDYFAKTVYPEELDKIEKAIMWSVEHGKYNAYLSGSLSEAAKSMLQRLGYVIEYISQYNEIGYRIHWEPDADCSLD